MTSGGTPLSLRPFYAGALLAFAVGVPALSAQVVPWLGSMPATLAAEPEEKLEATQPAAKPGPPSSEALRRARRRAREAERAREMVALPAAPLDDGAWFQLFAAIGGSPELAFAGFGAGANDGAPRSGTTWVGQTTQNAGTVTVGGTARDDNGWGASRLSLDASGMTYLNITAQRDAGHAAPTLFIQFEDLSLRTKVVSVSTAQFALGSMTLVQVPLTGWTVDFGPSQIVSWSLGGGNVGSVDFRMTFDDLTFTTTAIPEPASTALGVGLVAAFAVWRRRRTRRILCRAE